MVCCFVKLLRRLLRRQRRNGSNAKKGQKVTNLYDCSHLLLDDLANPIAFLLLAKACPTPSSDETPGSSKPASPPPSPSKQVSSPPLSKLEPPSPSPSTMTLSSAPSSPPPLQWKGEQDARDAGDESAASHWAVVCVDSCTQQQADAPSCRVRDDEVESGSDDVDFTLDISGDMPPPISADQYSGTHWTGVDGYGTPLFSTGGVWSNAADGYFPQHQWSPDYEREQFQSEPFMNPDAWPGAEAGCSTDGQAEEPELWFNVDEFLAEDICADVQQPEQGRAGMSSCMEGGAHGSVQQGREEDPCTPAFSMYDVWSSTELPSNVWQSAEQQNDDGRGSANQHCEAEGNLPTFPAGDTKINAEQQIEAEADAGVPSFEDAAWQHEAGPESELPPFLANGVWGGAEAGAQHWDASTSGAQQTPYEPTIDALAHDDAWYATRNGTQHQHGNNDLPPPLYNDPWGAADAGANQNQAPPGLRPGMCHSTQPWGATKQYDGVWTSVNVPAQHQQEHERASESTGTRHDSGEDMHVPY